jgi:hypothetical protein
VASFRICNAEPLGSAIRDSVLMMILNEPCKLRVVDLIKANILRVELSTVFFNYQGQGELLLCNSPPSSTKLNC